jgi:cobalt ABC transporter, permease protein CbiQ
MAKDLFYIAANQNRLFPAIIAGTDPRSRIIALCCFAICVILLKGFPSLFLALSLSALALSLSDIPVCVALKRMLAIDGFVLFMLCTLPFTVPGEPVFTLFGFTASYQGILYACRIALRANAIMLMMLSLLGRLEPTEFGHALFRLKVPENLVHLMQFTIRYIDVIFQEYRRLRVSMKARCFQPANSVHTYRSFGYLIGMMLVRSIERSQRIHDAMKCRGFTGKLVLLSQLRYTRRDIVFALVSFAAISLLLITETHFGPLV